ncbi:heme-copper oxidase subunit III [Rubellicoccus peritrichatus]|uniref:Heme-copper oxidase subunit III n=1 Tax=Rubellicoccus peritrichatus TaxID=3080537 RepID=A0AAQ3LBV0_9BACT|nr:heme-copper oxidase subunit III [Puniceicoccus sp. CR14]WOO41679.1 heme-copper oxidase subunit III [Puniceicoccus sp. CR14]
MSNSNTATAESQQEWKLPSAPKVGMICLIVMETALFTIFVVAYLYYIGKSLNGPFPKDLLEAPIIASICLLSSSGTVIMAERAFKRKDKAKFRLFWGITWLLGATFIALTAVEWKGLLENGLAIDTNLFGSTYYPLVGLHATHVIIGLFLLALIFILSITNHLPFEHVIPMEMISWYWHFVDAIWIVVFTVVYIIGVY